MAGLNFMKISVILPSTFHQLKISLCGISLLQKKKREREREYWSGLPFPSPDLDLPDPGIKPESPIL